MVWVRKRHVTQRKSSSWVGVIDYNAFLMYPNLLFIEYLIFKTGKTCCSWFKYLIQKYGKTSNSYDGTTSPIHYKPNNRKLRQLKRNKRSINRRKTHFWALIRLCLILIQFLAHFIDEKNVLLRTKFCLSICEFCEMRYSSQSFRSHPHITKF